MAELASGKLILDTPTEGVARLRISNPERRGALDEELLDALASTVGELDARCLVIAGSGGVFSAGYDLESLDAQTLEETPQRILGPPFSDAMEALESYRYPVIGQLNGHAIGGGLELALTCDIRVAAREAEVGMPPAKLGLIYPHAGLARFLDACGPANTGELFLMGRNVDAERAQSMGLVNVVVERAELDERVLDLASDVVANAPLSLAGNKRILRSLRAARWQLPPELERELVELHDSCFRSEDFREGVRAFTEKRKPRWQGR